MATRKTDEEKLQDIEQQLANLKKQKRRIQNKVKSEQRKERNHRLIQIGAEVEKYCGEIHDLEAWSQYIQQYANAIKRTQQSPSINSFPDFQFGGYEDEYRSY